MKWATLASVMVLTIASNAALANKLANKEGFYLTPKYAFEHRYSVEGNNMTVVVDPSACVKFGQGVSDELAAIVNGELDVLSADEENLADTVHMQTCTLAMLAGQALNLEIFARREDRSGYIPLSGSNIDISPIVTPMKKMAINAKHPMYVQYKEDGKPKSLYFPLGACVNPDEEGEIIIESNMRLFHEDIDRVREHPTLKKLLLYACLTMAAPYDIVKTTPALQDRAKRTLQELYEQ